MSTGYILTEDEYINMGADDLREELAKLARYTEELEEKIEALKEERDEIAGALEEERDARDDAEEEASDAADEIAGALEEFILYQAQAGGVWYRQDLRRCLENIAGAFLRLPTCKAENIRALITSTY